jgi:xylulokinase
MKILGVDIGTTGLKMGVFDTLEHDVELIKQYAESYEINSYNNGLFGDIEPDKWISAFEKGCVFLRHELADVEVISISGTTPALTPLNKDGEALHPAILMLDQRSRKQAKWIIDTVGLDYLFEHTGNMPVAGGCSLAGILWFKTHLSEIYQQTYKFAHSNTYFGCWLTDNFAIDPSSASLTGLYNTVKNDFTWNSAIAEACGVALDLLPELKQAYDSIGPVKEQLSAQLGFKHQPQVLIGGNDAVLAAYSAGIQEPGDIINVNGTSEITLICLPQCSPSPNYNVRAHVLPDKWLTLHVMNAGGKAYEWYKNLCCSEMSNNYFFNYFLPDAIDEWINKEISAQYIPYLMGSRYSLDPLKAEFKGLTVESSRSQMATAMVKGLCEYQKAHIEEIAQQLQLADKMHITGGVVSDSLIKAKKKWMSDKEYVFVDQSSMRGAAMLALEFQKTREK